MLRVKGILVKLIIQNSNVGTHYGITLELNVTEPH